MSASDTNSAIFVNDTPKDIKEKVCERALAHAPARHLPSRRTCTRPA